MPRNDLLMRETSDSNPRPSPVARFGRWLFSWRTFRRALVALAGLLTLVALLITEENWRGKRAWDNYRREREAKGERFDLASVVPPAVSEEQNFFTAPIVSRVFGSTNSEDQREFNLYRGDSEKWPTRIGSWRQATLTDLNLWQQYFRDLAGSTNAFPVAPQPQTPAADVLLALGQFNSALEELRRASLRPEARQPLQYESRFEAAGALLPFLASLKRCGQMLELRALAELDNGQSDQALADVKLLLRITDSTRNHPFLISHLVRIAMVPLTLQPIYEGLAQHRWSEPQLAELERELAKQDFLADYQSAMRGERVCAIASFEAQRITREYRTVEESYDTNKVVTVSLRFMPSAFFYQNELAFARLHEQFVLPLVDLTNRVASPARAQAAAAAVKSQGRTYSPYQVQALMVFPAIGKAVQKFAFAQSSIDLARVACALERYRLAQGGHPETLHALVPQFIAKLPHDIISGQPLKYRRDADGSFVLYSVGWNETDDGGKVVRRISKDGKEGAVDQDQGDWVWRYPAKVD
jgi:hypothetical protein